MVLNYLVHSIDSSEAEVIVPQRPFSQMQTSPTKAKKRQLFCLLLLANIIVWNVLYGICTAEKDKPIWEVVANDNLICKLWRKYPLISKSMREGTVIGILFNETNPMALVNNKLVHEGDSIGSVKVVEISPEKIQFEKDGKMWTQEVGERPSAVWEHF